MTVFSTYKLSLLMKPPGILSSLAVEEAVFSVISQCSTIMSVDLAIL